MALILRKGWEAYQVLFHDITDPRTKSLPFVAKPYQTLGLLALYLMFVLKWGPKLMQKRQPFDLKYILIFYNAAQVLICSYIFYESIYLGWGWKFKWMCEPLDTSYSDNALAITRCVYLYYLTKLIDLLDTVFFVLRKKQNQVTFLHIYHHTGMVMLVWGAATYFPGGHGTLIGVINSFVHAVMYAYYLITVIYPKAKESIWWKKHITQLQILQFLWCVIHMAAIVFIPDCAYPRWISAVFLPQNIFMLVLFVDFYIKTYVKRPQKIKVNNTLKTESKNVISDNYNVGQNDQMEEGKKENGVSLNISYFASQIEKDKKN